MSVEESKAPPPSDQPEPTAEKGIDPTADLETREAQAREYLFSIIDDEPDEAPPPPAQKDDGTADKAAQPDKGKERQSLGEQTRRARQELRRAESDRRELQGRLEALRGKDPIALLDELGLDKADVVDRILLGDKSPSDIGEGASKSNSELAERVRVLEQELRSRNQGASQSEAIKSIASVISDDSHFWLHQEDGPAEVVLQYLTAEYEKDPHSDMTIEEAAEVCEKFYADRAGKIQSASQRKSKGADSPPPSGDAPARNLSNAGGSAAQKTWEQLSVEEREKHSIADLKQSLRSRG